jgi:hypothetical protein
MSARAQRSAQPPVQCVPGVLPQGREAASRSWSHRILAPRLKMSGAVPLLPYTFLAWTETTLPFLLSCKNKKVGARGRSDICVRVCVCVCVSHCSF